VDPFVDRFREKHRDLAEKLLHREAKACADLNHMIDQSSDELKAILQSIKILGESSKPVLDRIASRGERVLARIFQSALQESGCPSQVIDGTEVIALEKSFGTLFPDLQRSREQIQNKCFPLLEKEITVVIPGYIGTGPQGELVTLGRGGSDLSAAVIAHGLRAQSVTLFKEVDGLMTADPKCVKEARVVPELHYREASELAFFGAKILHPRTIIPLIPLVIKPTLAAHSPGTRIAGDVPPGAFPVKALTAMRGQSLISIEGGGMMGVPGVAARTFQALAEARVSVSLISQGSSEASICLAVAETEVSRAVDALKESFHLEIKHSLIDTIRVTQDLSILAIVGLGMSGTPGIASRTFGALGRTHINIIAIAQGSSELNISLVIQSEDVEVALQALHREFRLEKLKVLAPQKHGDVSLALMGFGQIGRTLVRQVMSQELYLKKKMGLAFHWMGIADRSGFVINSNGIAHDVMTQLLETKEAGHSLRAKALESTLWDLPVRKAIFIDTTAHESLDTAKKALKAGWHVVFANKKPLAVKQQDFEDLFATARQKNLAIRYEATVGAGLPILDTLAKLQEVGDSIRYIEGCFSGTLGFLMTEISSGVPFSEAVNKAFSRGYTEPDPREDLSGVDVARKILILARTIGMRCDLGEIPVECLFDQSCDDKDPRSFIDKLAAFDGEWHAKIERAHRMGVELRYVGRIEVLEGGAQGHAKISVGLREVPQESPLGRLRGTDNLVLIRTQRYDQNPLVVSGPGAGAEVTAAGVFNDILAIATSEA
jgi:aspartokinase/homoserine dehydrogenase 1